MDAERAHRLVFGTLRALGPIARGLARLVWGAPDPRLKTPLGPLTLAGPIGLAAGLDKEGTLARFWPALGFGFVELGTTTALAQPGNPRPRLFRFPEAHALVNRMGFNNRGSQVLARRLSGLRPRGRSLAVPVGVNLGKSKVTPLEDAARDYVTSAQRVRGVADYLVINVSSPNTPGLRKLQDASFLSEIVGAVVTEVPDLPVWVKLAPDLTDDAVREAVGVAEAGGAAGIIATNTTIERFGLPDVGPGGLSGGPLHPRSLEVVRLVAEATELPVIGVGGISTADHVCAMLGAGAAAVQLYSALIFEGPGLIHRLNRALIGRMDRDGLADLSELRRAIRSSGD